MISKGTAFYQTSKNRLIMLINVFFEKLNFLGKSHKRSIGITAAGNCVADLQLIGASFIKKFCSKVHR